MTMNNKIEIMAGKQVEITKYKIMKTVLFSIYSIRLKIMKQILISMDIVLMNIQMVISIENAWVTVHNTYIKRTLFII